MCRINLNLTNFCLHKVPFQVGLKLADSVPDISQYFVACAFILSYLADKQCGNWSPIHKSGTGQRKSGKSFRVCSIKSLDHSCMRFSNKVTSKCRKMADFNSEQFLGSLLEEVMTVMTGLFRSLTLRSARHSLEMHGGKAAKVVETSRCHNLSLLAEGLCLVQHL